MVEVFQREYAFATLANGNETLHTTLVTTCTLWYGIDEKNGVAFICHIDFPCFANTIPQILRELLELVPSEHSFRSFILGGYCWSWWSKITKNKIQEQCALNSNVKITIENSLLRPSILGEGYSIDVRTGKINKSSSKALIRTSIHERLANIKHIISLKPMKRAPFSA